MTKELIGKKCDISLLKGITYKSFRNQNNISQKVAKAFLTAKRQETKKTNSCIVCGSKNLKHSTKVFKIDYIQCQNCNHAMRKNSYNQNFLKRFWKKKGDIINVHSHKNQQNYRTKFLSKPKVEKVLEFLKIKSNMHWLDMGCGNGEFLQQVKKNRIIPCGFDLNEKDIKFAKKKKLNVFRTDIRGFEKINKSKLQLKFDVISATGYFDVIDSPKEAIIMTNKMLKKNGLLMIDVPNYDSFTHEMIKFYPKYSIRHLSAVQRSSFTLKSLTYLLKKNGFKVIFRWIYGLDLYMIMNYLVLNNKNFEKSKIISVFSKRYNDFQKIIDEEKLSGTLFLIAKKSKELK